MTRPWVAGLALLLGTVLLAVAFLGGPGPNRPAAAQEAAAPLTREAVEAIIREYLLQNPELIMESVRALQQRQQTQERERVAGVLAARQAELQRDPDAPVAGNPRGDVTIVEFFDYRCGYCKSVAPTLRQLLEQDGNVRLVYKEFPILGPDSVVAARIALAAHRQGKYEQVHTAFMAHKGSFDERTLLALAASVGADATRLAADMQDPAIQGQLQATDALAAALGITGTPGFLFGNQLVPGAIALDEMKKLVSAARASPG